jgi:hypothetical protein
VGSANVFGTTRRKRAKQARKKTDQIIKLHRLFADDKKSLDQLIYGLSFLVGEPSSSKQKTKNKK